MSEYLSFNKAGQWALHKAVAEQPRSDYRSTSEKHKVFGGKAKDGMLHEDRGRKGMLHGQGNTGRPKANRIDWGYVGKPAHTMESVHNERNPGVGD
jgi:hypothetical protein